VYLLEWNFDTNIPSVQRNFAQTDERSLKVTSIAHFESTDPPSKVWCTRAGICEEPGPQGPQTTYYPDAAYLDSAGVWHHETIEPIYQPHAATFRGLLAVDTTTTPTSLVFGYRYNCPDDATPWAYFDAQNHPDALYPPVTLLRRWPGALGWAPAAPNVLRGNLRAMGVAHHEAGGYAFYAVGDQFALDPSTENEADRTPAEYFRAGVFRNINAGAWEQEPGKLWTKNSIGWFEGGVAHAFARHASECLQGEEFVVGGAFRGVRYTNRSSLLNPLLSSQVAVYGYSRTDFNLDGSKDFFDYDDYVVCFEDPNCTRADFNCDGSVDFFDYDDFVFWFEFNNP
jgi:hypothetical protein